MNTIVFSPYGTRSQESGILYLLASYMNAQGLSITRATCNGVVSVCDQDRSRGWKRGLHGCMECISDARNLQKWSQVDDVELSTYIFPEEIERTRRWVLKLGAGDISTAEFDGGRLFDLCEETFFERFSVSKPEPGMGQHERFARRLLLSAARMKILSRRLFREGEYTSCFLAGGKEYLSAVFGEEARLRDVAVSTFHWKSGSRHVEILTPLEESFQCEVLLDSVASMRQDVKSWPAELVQMLDELLECLGVVQPEAAVGMAS